MNNCARIVSCLSVAITLAADAATNSLDSLDSASDGLIFRNGDFLSGKLADVDDQGMVRWRRVDASDPIEFRLDSIAQIDFPEPASKAKRAGNACRLTLNDGNSLEGQIVSYDHGGLVLQTWYAGRVSIPHDALKSVAFLPRSPALLDGITGLEGWTQGVSTAIIPNENGHWIYRNGAFYADKAASIARDVKLPDVAEIQFDLNWKGGLNLAVALYTDSLQPILLTAKEQGPNFGGFYSLRFQYSAFVDLWPIKKSEPLRPLGQLYIPALNTSDHLNVDLRISKPRHKVALLLDGKLVKEWVDPEGFAGEGTGVRFVQNPPGIIKLSDLRITKWDGNFAGTNDEPEDTKHDAFWPENAARVTGTIDSVADGKLTATTSKGPVEFPLAMINQIEFAHRQAVQPQPQGNLVRATFAQGGSIIFQLENWKPEKVTARSPDFGKIKIDPAAITRLQFLTPDKKPVEGPKS